MYLKGKLQFHMVGDYDNKYANVLSLTDEYVRHIFPSAIVFYDVMNPHNQRPRNIIEMEYFTCHDFFIKIDDRDFVRINLFDFEKINGLFGYYLYIGSVRNSNDSIDTVCHLKLETT